MYQLSLNKVNNNKKLPPTDPGLCSVVWGTQMKKAFRLFMSSEPRRAQLRPMEHLRMRLLAPSPRKIDKNSEEGQSFWEEEAASWEKSGGRWTFQHISDNVLSIYLSSNINWAGEKVSIFPSDFSSAQLQATQCHPLVETGIVNILREGLSESRGIETAKESVRVYTEGGGVCTNPILVFSNTLGIKEHMSACQHCRSRVKVPSFPARQSRCG